MKHHLKIGFGNALKNGTLSFAKLFGITISFAVILFVAGYALYETSYDKSIPDHDRIYRCLVQGTMNAEEIDYAVTTSALAPVIARDIPEITETVRIINQQDAQLIYEHENFEASYLLFADSSFFSFFNIPVLTNLENPLESFNNIVISNRVAEIMFGSAENALNKVVVLRGQTCTISGVFEDFPDNFHLRAGVIQSISVMNPDSAGWDLQSSSVYTLCYTYFKTIQSDINLDALNFKISKTAYTYNDQGIDGANATGWDDFRTNDGTYIKYVAEPLTDIHLSNHKFDLAITNNKANVYGAIILTLFVLLISSINFVNLTIATISTRTKEIGILKTSGAENKHILLQFLYEIVVFCIIGFLSAVAIYLIFKAPLVRYLNLDLALTNSMLPKVMVLFFLVLAGINLLANFLPVLIFSRKEGLNLIKSEKTVGTRILGSNIFILVQFVLSALIIICSLIVQKQINYMVNKDRGYDYENIMRLSLWPVNTPQARQSFIEQLEAYDAVEAVSTTLDVIGEADFGATDAYFETMEERNAFHTSTMRADVGLLNTFDIEMKDGRFFERERQTDFNTVVLNETAADLYTGNGSILGKNIYLNGQPFEVIGIVKDFNYRSLHNPIDPLIITQRENMQVAFIKIKDGRTAEVINIVQQLWDSFNLDYEVNYKFHGDALIEQYAQDRQAKKILLMLSVISVLIACVGLYAISSFTIVKRVKEVGIRKVNGARVSEILTMLNKDFVKWVVIAFVIATPVAWYTMNKWLESFAYKTNLSWWIFALAGLLALGIALLTVSWQSWRAATRNPVEALRYE